ncbi:MAG: hypothetical protein KDK08_01480, partial [Rhizobiaceae bacterium]|nr:hypothetical protein [Rhizobiaceae bacterium]
RRQRATPFPVLVLSGSSGFQSAEAAATDPFSYALGVVRSSVSHMLENLWRSVNKYSPIYGLHVIFFSPFFRHNLPDKDITLIISVYCG